MRGGVTRLWGPVRVPVCSEGVRSGAFEETPGRWERRLATDTRLCTKIGWICPGKPRGLTPLGALPQPPWDFAPLAVFGQGVCDGQRLVAWNPGVDAQAPSLDASGHGLGFRKALLAQESGRVRAPHSRVAGEHDSAFLGQRQTALRREQL